MIGQLVCLKHRTYVGDGAPRLDCKTCCTIFVEKIKVQNSKRSEAVEKGSNAVLERPETNQV